VIFRPRTAWAIIVPDSDEDRTQSGILFPDDRRKKRHSGTVILHQPSLRWELSGEAPLDGQRVLFEAWAWREFRLDGPELYLVPERAIFATLEDTVNKTDLISELQDKIKNIVKAEVDHDDDVTTDEAANIDAVLGGDLATEIVEDADEEDMEDPDNNTDKDEA
jgi:co-chaperonin GroES (HSP10)